MMVLLHEKGGFQLHVISAVVQAKLCFPRNPNVSCSCLAGEAGLTSRC